MNILPIIAAAIEHFDYWELPASRGEILDWITKPSLNGDTLSIQEVHKIDDLNLCVDALIVAGIGRSQEQTQTVHCVVTHG